MSVFSIFILPFLDTRTWKEMHSDPFADPAYTAYLLILAYTSTPLLLPERNAATRSSVAAAIYIFSAM